MLNKYKDLLYLEFPPVLKNIEFQRVFVLTPKKTVHQGKCYYRVILVISTSGTDMSNTEHLSQKLVVPIPNSVSQGAIQLIHSWFTNKMLKVNRTQVRKQVRAKGKGNMKTEHARISTMC